jgi:hypothetical protein
LNTPVNVTTGPQASTCRPFRVDGFPLPGQKASSASRFRSAEVLPLPFLLTIGVIVINIRLQNSRLGYLGGDPGGRGRGRPRHQHRNVKPSRSRWARRPAHRRGIFRDAVFVPESFGLFESISCWRWSFSAAWHIPGVILARSC